MRGCFFFIVSNFNSHVWLILFAFAFFLIRVQHFCYESNSLDPQAEADNPRVAKGGTFC